MIASGNHLLTQVKDNQPSLRRKLKLGTAGRKPIGSDKNKTAGRNRWETRELTVFPAKAWFRHTPWENLIKTVLRLERTVYKRNPATGLCTQTNEVAFWVSSASAQRPSVGTNGYALIGASRMAVTTYATPPSPRTLPAGMPAGAQLSTSIWCSKCRA